MDSWAEFLSMHFEELWKEMSTEGATWKFASGLLLLCLVVRKELNLSSPAGKLFLLWMPVHRSFLGLDFLSSFHSLGKLFHEDIAYELAI
jgi:hypothetical protein